MISEPEYSWSGAIPRNIWQKIYLLIFIYLEVENTGLLIKTC